ncbi:hypothetical protein CLM62_15815 [Streptomyces sp. SA15]|uniref:hypothetical protein n=1 Tax=Streptomyces sp. SA15 TaxID=934019 RepID=UPI000BB07296|nr:hypothetical protein [Streptomyces sp. SA15]PAZ15071.1 hypothetical protein CLM62_15815 [Streptomyces sp. SA15]
MTVHRRYAVAVSAVMTAAVALSACGGGNDDEGRKPPRESSSASSTATPTDSAPSSGADAARDPATPSDMFWTYRAVYGPAGSPACDGVPWDDAVCGEDLTAAGKTADAIARHIDKEFPGGQYADTRDSADQVVRTVNSIRKLGCYKMGAKQPRSDPAKLRELCPTLSTVASLSWLGFTSSVDTF